MNRWFQYVTMHAPLHLIMLVAALLRMWKFSSIPFTHDEYSSLYRAQHSSVSDMIELGVITDTHPPLSQFIYYLIVKCWGREEVYIKFPYVLMGIASVYLVYALGKRWFTKTTGLLAASFFAILQECVIHSQTARPYSLGCFLLLLAALTITKLVEEKSGKSIFYLFGAALLFVLSALSHHFCMLTAFVLFAFIFILYRKTHWKSLSIVAALSMLLYMPNILILKAQLAQGGIGTVVGKPDAAFLLQYFAYLTHFSWTILALVFSVLLITFFYFNKKINVRWLLVSISVFVFTFSTGYIYSVRIAPVLQFRVLYFALPFLLLWLFSFTKEWNYNMNLAICTIVLAVGSCSLVFERYHYRVFYTSGYEGVWNAAAATGNARHLLAFTPYMLAFQNEKHGRDLSVTNPDSSWVIKDYSNFVDTCTASGITLGFTMQYYKPPVEVFGMLANKFGNISKHHNYFNSWFYSFSRDSSLAENHLRLSAEQCEYNISDKAKNHDNSTGFSFSPNDEYGFLCSFKLPHITVKHTDWIVAHAAFHTDKPCNAELVLEVFHKEKSIYWRGVKHSDYWTEGIHTTDVYAGLYTPDILKADEEYRIAAYIWNHGDSLEVDNLCFYAVPGNPMMYSLQAPVTKADLINLPTR